MFCVALHSETQSFDGILIGNVEAADGDRNDKLEFSLRGQHAGLFEIDSKGSLYIRPEQLQGLNESTVHLIAIATDSGVPQRSTSVPVTIALDGVALAQVSWRSNLIGILSMIISVFILIVLVLTCYILRSKRKIQKASPPLGRNRVHSNAHSAVSSANLVTHEQISSNGTGAIVMSGTSGVSVLHMKNDGNITMSNPIGNCVDHAGVGLPNSTTTLAKREQERDHERQRESYAATVRSIVSRASANGQLFEDNEIENDSLSNQDNMTSETNNKKTAWGPTANAQRGVLSVANLNCNAASGSNLLAETETMGSSENNLTVYF
ncbi:PREDICTED: uncharacterized protein LOC108367649 [Rhagoletis zephyria]|uniref:uncharacterized protein LOC108367649 n=1 Tax=Rhagoletis zephyria TaxID=28612 RepID=UPI0008116E1F|nr:PREDICTED: uncharacterized protein LOC108367649 [Rhagoletis zephyria]